MSLYNMINGFSPACLLVMPMLGRKQEEYPRFRDCFVEGENIAIYTRVGGNNRGCGFGEEELYKDPNFINTYDDDFDNTYTEILKRTAAMLNDDRFACVVVGNYRDRKGYLRDLVGLTVKAMESAGCRYYLY